MHVEAPKEASTCRSKGPKKVSGWKEPMITSLGVAVSKEKSYRWRWWKIWSQDHTEQCLIVVTREMEMQEWHEQKLPKVLPGYSGGTLPGRSTKEKGREEGEVDEDSGKRRIRSQIAQEVVPGIKEKARAHDGIKEFAPRPAGQSFMRSEDWPQIENEEEEESWREGDQMAAQWNEEHILEDILERGRMEGSSLKLEVMQKVPELVVH